MLQKSATLDYKTETQEEPYSVEKNEAFLWPNLGILLHFPPWIYAPMEDDSISDNTSHNEGLVRILLRGRDNSMADFV